MNIDSIKNGYVIDHIKAGQAMKIYEYLKLGDLDCSVAIIKNAKSNKMGKKDIIKIDEKINIDFNVIGYIDHNITIKIIENNKKIKKFHPDLEEEGNCMPNKIKLVLDGMNGTFARLVYVLAVSYDVAWVDEDNDILNDNLKENVVPENVFKELNTVYMQLTGQELQKENVKLKEWHLWG